MQQRKDVAIVLSRIDYGERDRILTLLCSELGKISVLAKGVRSEKSRLAGGIELLSESDVVFIGRQTGLKTLTGARLRVHYGSIVKDIKRMSLAFQFLKAISKIIEEGTGQEYYPILREALSALDKTSYDTAVIEIWFALRLLELSGSSPNLIVDDTEAAAYAFDPDNQQFIARADAMFRKEDIKLLRVCAVSPRPPRFEKQPERVESLQQLIRQVLQSNLTEI